MTLRDLPPPIFVSDQEGMAVLIEDLARQTEIAFDTEADSFYSYREKVCLVQVTVEDRDYVVDPLADLDLTALGNVLADPTKTKVFHDGEYDVLILKRDFGFDFAALFDTRVAAAALGMEAPGLAAVIQERFDVEIDKSMQRSDWAKRPLSDRQIRYARLDTHFLLPLMHELRGELVARDRAMIVEGECRRLEALQPVHPSFHPDEFVKIKGARRLAPLARQCMRELYALREEFAEAGDVPPFRVMRNPLLIDLSEVQPTSLDALAAIKGFSPRMVRTIGARVIEAIAHARELGPLDEVPTLPKRDGTDGMSDVEAELYDRLKKWRKGIAERQGVEASYLLNRHVMARVACERPAERRALEAVDGVLDWQAQMFGDDLVGLISQFESDVRTGKVPKRRPWRRR